VLTRFAPPFPSEYPQWREQCKEIAAVDSIEALEAGRAEMMAGLQVVLATEGNPEPLAFLMHVMDEHIAKLRLETQEQEDEQSALPPQPLGDNTRSGDAETQETAEEPKQPQKSALHAQFDELIVKLISVEARRQELAQRDDEFKFKLVKMHSSFLEQVRVTIFVGSARSLAKSDCCCVLKWTASLAELQAESAPSFEEAQELGAENATCWAEKGKTQVSHALRCFVSLVSMI
jgi:hypothetical protein